MRKFFALFSVLSVFLFSCSNNSESFDSFDETETLQFEANRLENEIDWQVEIEGEILTREIKKKDGIDSTRVTLTHRAVLASEKISAAEKIYPYIEGFGSLDLSDFTVEKDGERRKLIDDFCGALVECKDLDSFFDKTSIFSLVVFLDELKKATTINFFELQEISKSAEDASVSKLKKSKKIDSYIMGKPFDWGNSFSVPVRFKIGKENLDVEIFIEKFSNEWKIDEIEIRRFG